MEGIINYTGCIYLELRKRYGRVFATKRYMFDTLANNLYLYIANALVEIMDHN